MNNSTIYIHYPVKGLSDDFSIDEGCDKLFCFVNEFYEGFKPCYLTIFLCKQRSRKCKLILPEMTTIDFIAVHRSVTAK